MREEKRQYDLEQERRRLAEQERAREQQRQFELE